MSASSHVSVAKLGVATRTLRRMRLSMDQEKDAIKAN